MSIKSSTGRALLPYVISFVFAIGISFSQSVSAHFKLNLNIRVLHVEHVSDGLNLYLRLPMPYLVANLVGPENADGVREPAPFTTNTMLDDELMHYLDSDAVGADALPLGQLAADGHIISVKGRSLEPSVQAVRVHTGDLQPPFSTLEEAHRVFDQDQHFYSPAPFVGDTVVDVKIHYPTAENKRNYLISSVLNPQLPGQEDTANLILDYAGDEQRIYRITGLLEEPLQVSRSAWNAARTFVYDGIKHILAGYDHVLYVICLVMGAITLVGLAWRITGFTIGHSVTLTLGYFGFVPKAEWFIPAVETGIALSIIYAAVVALMHINNKGESVAGGGIIVTVAIGLLHGLGFSFVLREILGLHTANIWMSLLSFNIGVELGQLCIVLLLWPVLYLLLKFKRSWHHTLVWVLGLFSVGIASIWAGQRMIAVINSL